MADVTDLDVRIEPKDEISTRVRLYAGGEPVSGLLINRRRMRVGCSTVLMGGIGAVGTREPHRMKGYMRRVMERAVEWMDGEHYDFSVLYGIRDFYTRWGFATICSGSAIEMKTAAAARCPSTLPVRSFARGDMPAILGIYHRQNGLRTASVIRKPFPDDGFRKGSQFFVRPRIFVVTTPRGRLVGYAAIDDQREDREAKTTTPIRDRVVLCEVGASDLRAYFSVLAEAARQARELNVESIQAHLPLDHPFAVFCRRWGVNTWASYPSCGAAMARIISVPRALRRIRKELARRLQDSGVTEGSVWVETDAGSAAIRLSSGEVTVNRHRQSGMPAVTLPQPLLTQALLGVRCPEVLLSDERVRTDGDVRPFAEALCRPEVPYMWTADHF